MWREVEKDMRGLEDNKTRKLQCKHCLQMLHHTKTISSAAQANHYFKLQAMATEAEKRLVPSHPSLPGEVEGQGCSMQSF